MCRADVAPAAQAPLAAVLVEMAATLAEREHLDPAETAAIGTASAILRMVAAAMDDEPTTPAASERDA